MDSTSNRPASPSPAVAGAGVSPEPAPSEAVKSADLSRGGGESDRVVPALEMRLAMWDRIAKEDDDGA